MSPALELEEASARSVLLECLRDRLSVESLLENEVEVDAVAENPVAAAVVETEGEAEGTEVDPMSTAASEALTPRMEASLSDLLESEERLLRCCERCFCCCCFCCWCVNSGCGEKDLDEESREFFLRGCLVGLLREEEAAAAAVAEDDEGRSEVGRRPRGLSDPAR